MAGGLRTWAAWRALRSPGRERISLLPGGSDAEGSKFVQCVEGTVGSGLGLSATGALLENRMWWQNPQI